jgi:ribosomal protein S17
MEKNQVRKTTKVGVVVSSHTKKTVVVLVERPVRHYQTLFIQKDNKKKEKISRS